MIEIFYIIIMAVAIYAYYLVGRKKPKDLRKRLYISLYFDGCQTCGGNLEREVGVLGTMDGVKIECEDCGSIYRVNDETKVAYRERA